jgi:biotin carboxylase
VCAAAGYDGVVHAELLEHADGTTLIELNPRLSGTTWFRERLGLQPTERAVRLALGLPALPPVRVPAGRTFHVLPLEARVAARSGRLSSLRALGWWRPGDRVDGVTLTDPWPTVSHYVGRLSRNHQ